MFRYAGPSPTRFALSSCIIVKVRNPLTANYVVSSVAKHKNDCCSHNPLDMYFIHS